MADDQSWLLGAIGTVPASAMLRRLRELLAARVGAQDVDLLLPDYRLSVLRTLERPEVEVPVEGSDAGHSFITQQVLLSGGARPMCYAPISLRGDRLGVLALRLPEAPAEDRLAWLAQAATVIGYALTTAAGCTDTFLRTARTQRLSLAAEMQWQLLPGRSFTAAEFAVAGQVEPAYHVCADHYDWSRDESVLTVTASDSNSRGGEAALLTTLAVTALRNARRAGLGVADQARLADQAVYAHHQGRRFLSTLLVQLDLTSGVVHAVDAGSPRLLHVRAGRADVVELDHQLPLGMFDATPYVEQRFTLERGDRLLMVTDGLHEAADAEGRSFGTAALERALFDLRGETPAEVVRLLIAALRRHRSGADLDDDATVVCLDWTGPEEAS